MYEPGGAENTGKDTVKCIIRGVQMLKERCAHLVVVTNDVFRESVPDSEEMTAYKDNSGDDQPCFGQDGGSGDGSGIRGAGLHKRSFGYGVRNVGIG